MPEETRQTMASRGTVSLSVQGMSCAACAARIERALNAQPGVSRAAVSLMTEEARIQFDPAVSTPEGLIKAIESLGYKAIMKPDEMPQTEARDPALARAQRDLWVAWGGTAPIVILMSLHMVWGLMPPAHHWIELGLSTVVLATAGLETFRRAWQSLLHRSPGMDLLIALGAGAGWTTAIMQLAGARVESFAGVAAMILAFHLTGRYWEARARSHSSAAIRRLLELGAKTARKESADGGLEEVPIEQIAVGDILHIRPGEKIPLDGVVIEGNSAVDESMVSGEPLPVDKGPDAKVIGATINTTGTLRIRVTHIGNDTFLAQVARIVAEAQADKPPIQTFADQITALFVPAILLLAACTFLAWLLLPQLMHELASWATPWLPWTLPADAARLTLAVYAAVAVLVISCPCAMGLATPTAILAGTAFAAARGILIRNGAALETLRHTRIMCFDKTGTITYGKPEVVEILPAEGISPRTLLETAAALERHSEHPIAHAILRAAEKERVVLGKVEAFSAFPGKGAQGVQGDITLRAGKREWLEELGIPARSLDHDLDRLERQGRSVILIARDTQCLGAIAVADTLRTESVRAVKILKRLGIRCVLLSGDHQGTTEIVAQQTAMDRALGNLLPEEKARAIQTLKQETIGRVAMVGDGINDAGALAAADVGIAMGAGTDIAIETADITLVSSNLSTLVHAVIIARAAYRKILQNLFWAFGYNLLAIPLAAIGLLHPLVAEICMALSSLNVIFNSLSLRRLDIEREIARAKRR